MGWLLIILFTIPNLFSDLKAEDDNSPLIPARKNSSSEINYLGIKDPFAPPKTSSTPYPKTTITPTEKSPESKEEPAEPEDEFDDKNKILKGPSTESDPSSPSDDLEKLSSEPNSQNMDSWEQELLHGKDEDFKPAPLKIDAPQRQSEENQESSLPVIETPAPQKSFILPEEHNESTSQEIPTDVLTSTATPTPSPTPIPSATPSITPSKQPITQEQIRPGDLVTEEVDPWDDPRKNVSTSCRLQLERLKKKKKMLDRAEGTLMRLQDSLLQKKGDQTKIRQLSGTLELKIKELKKDILYVKERAVRQGCPGVYF